MKKSQPTTPAQTTQNEQANLITKLLRELEIEAALEEVRSRALAMHKSDELQEEDSKEFNKL